MSDIYQPDPNRLLIDTTTGGVQGWKPDSVCNDVVVSLSFYCSPSKGGDGHSTYSQFMTAADARSLAEALLKCADHAESFVPKEEAA